MACSRIWETVLSAPSRACDSNRVTKMLSTRSILLRLASVLPTSR